VFIEAFGNCCVRGTRIQESTDVSDLGPGTMQEQLFFLFVIADATGISETLKVSKPFLPSLSDGGGISMWVERRRRGDSDGDD
jgi:hypothetical protein